LQASKQGVFAAFFTNDGREILTLCDDRITRRWDAASYELLGEIKGPPLRGSIPKNQGGWKEVEGIGEYPVAAAYTSAGLRVLTGAEKGFMVRDEKNQVVCEIRHEAKGAHGIMGRNPDGQVSPDGTKVVIVFGQRQPPEESVFDAQTGEKLFAISGHRDYIQFAVFSPDSSRLVSCSRDTTARVWDTKTGRLVATFTGHTAEVGAVAFSPDGKRAASWSRQQQDGEVVARIWEVESGREVSRLEVPKNEGACVAQVFFSPDGKTVVTCNQHGGGGFNPESLSVLCIWDAATGKRLHTLLPRRLDDYDYRSKASVAALSRDGRLLAAGSENGVVRLFDAAKGELLRELLGHEGELSDIQFHADGRTLLTAATDGSVRLWDIVGPEDELYHGVWRRIHGLTASPDGRRLLLSRTTQEKVALLVNRDEGRTHTLAGHRWGIDVRGFSGDGAKALTASSNAVFIWEASTGKLLRELRPDGDGRRIDAAALSADGKVAFSQARGGPAQLWDVTTGKALRSLQEPIVEVAGIQTGLFTADSARLLTTRGRLVPPLVGDAMRVTLWDVATGRRLHEFEDDRENKTGEFGTIDGGTSFGIISPDGARVLTCSSNGTARIWDAVSGERGPRLIGHTGGVTWGAFSPDGRLAATASQDGTARLWDVATGKELRVFRGHETGLERGRKTGLICVQFSPNGTRLLTAASDGKARVVAVATGKLIRHFPLLPGRERFAAFLDDDTIVSLASEIVRIWAVDALAEAKRRKPRELTPAEREKYEVDGVAR
jgi:WD40 repeat protein